MQVEQVLSILDSLAAGGSPELFASADAQQAISTAAALLKGRPAAAGARWSDEEDARLVAEFDGGTAIPEIARLHGRSRAAITLRLVKLGKLEESSVKVRGRG